MVTGKLLLLEPAFCNNLKADRLQCEAALQKWEGREERMFFVLRQKYGAEKDEL